jgi:hypothetical protein
LGRGAPGLPVYRVDRSFILFGRMNRKNDADCGASERTNQRDY